MTDILTGVLNNELSDERALMAIELLLDPVDRDNTHTPNTMVV